MGYEGVDKRIDVLATAIRAGLKATELKDLDLAYAPPYSSAKDPVNMAGFMIENIANGVLKQWHLADVDKLPQDGSVALLDTRTVEEYAGGHKYCCRLHISYPVQSFPYSFFLPCSTSPGLVVSRL